MFYYFTSSFPKKSDHWSFTVMVFILGDLGILNINSNYSASFASNATKSASKGLNSAMEKLSTGLRINYAKDDAAGLAISMRLKAELQGISMASRNA